MSRLKQDYLTLRKEFSAVPNHQAISITITKIANLLFCTPRNAKNIISKMIEAKLLEYQGGVGRGNASTIVFLRSLEDVVLDEAKSLAASGKIEEGFKLVKEYGSIHTSTQLIEWVGSLFGYTISKSEHEIKEMIRLPIYRDINTLDPAKCFYRLDSHMVKQIFDRLVDYDAERNEVTAKIAHNWKVNDDYTVWTFYLRKGILFHDGNDLTSQDVIYTFNRLKEKHPLQQWIVENIVSINRKNNYSIVFKLKNPNCIFPQFLAYIPTSIVSKSKQDPIGSGSYMVKEYHPGKCRLSAFQQYYFGRPHIDIVELLHIPQSEENGELKDLMLQVRTGEELTKREAGWQEQESFLAGCVVLTFNLNKNGPLKELFLRKAISYFIDRRQLLFDLGEPRFSPAESFELKLKTTLTDRDFSIIDGKENLKQTKYNGESLSLYTYKRHEDDAKWISAQLRTHGINIEPIILSWQDMQNPDVQNKADMILFEAVLGEGEVQFIELMQSGYSFIHNHLDEISKEKIDIEIRNIMSIPDINVRNQRVKGIEQLLKNESLLTFLVHKSVATSSHPSLKGVKINEKGWVDFKEIWFDQEADSEG
ncbi:MULTISPECIES: ABC transporter substrate-binding protein [unclassified Bacillus (in: firmicutes)]|uniref:ABC transporter substrate-binding protein n=1 Tax=unclassified Bacillus (in: firmicutes) TaxID=185979 RepID=UPI0008ECED95|nr:MULTISPECIES: ABC transporter substrate-binding protein [unclassified Bacillus (in: firmicutes)]SFA88121.1 DNA-binding transcriptional regulator SgrR of sgrS sRNA, contains a MarR-type HTH domain and a solute-binding domain [Bacillus sp. UNCCL13]SFQ84515.1 DNA-binding transcriptional regulator SgrR of sgrS sRNA, contains a MarR-type HTH domain and a solute-binding domain [Bacillus sp. cl95]